MNKSAFLAVAVALAFASPLSPANANTGAMKPDSALEAAAFEKQIDVLTAKYEAFQIAAAEDENFRKNWLNRLRVMSAVDWMTASPPHLVQSPG